MDSAFFFDTSLVGREIDDELWNELLRCPRRLFMINRVWQELKPHFAAVPAHPLANAIRGRNSALVLHQEPDSGPRADALLYYVNLLAIRRDELQRAVRAFTRENGRPPNDEEMGRIEADYQRTFGERGVMLTKKPLSAFLTDETVVYLAVEHAVRTGQPTVILAADHDVEEQFMKMIELLTMHYWAMLVAREHHADFTRFSPRVVDPERAAATKLFRSATLLDLHGRRLQQFRPERIQFVPISCMTIGPYVSQLTYGAETAMAELLDVKGRTGGRSTDLLGDRDLHTYFLPPIPGEPDDYTALISDDIYQEIPGSPIKLAKLDLLFATSTQVSMSPMVPMPSSNQVMVPIPPLWR